MGNGYPKELEVQRVMNLVSGFGWEKTKEEVIGKDVIITIKKTVLTDDAVASAPIPS